MRWIGTLMMIAACHDAGPAIPDSSLTGPDAKGPEPGVVVSWSAQPALPGPISDRITVTEATFSVELLEVLGAQASGGPEREHFELAWRAGGIPEVARFHDAPPDLYQLVKLRFDGPDHAYEIRGTWVDAGGVARTFRIEDEMPMNKQLVLARSLLPGGQLALAIDVKLGEALAGIDYAALGTRRGPDKDGEDLQLRNGDPQMRPFQMRLSAGLQLEP